MSSDQMASADQWAHQIRPAFQDSWFADLFSRDADDSLTPDDQPLSPFPSSTPTPTPTASASSDPESAPKSLGRRPIPATAAGGSPRGRVSKRKSRAPKRSQTTFITADPANFRQMVQHVTGVRVLGPHPSVLKPQPQRAAGRPIPPGAAVSMGGGYLPSLDASAWPQNHSGAIGQGTVPLVVAGDGGLAGVMSFDSIASFPTLESWKPI